MNQFVRSASFLAVANTVEAAALHLKDMQQSLVDFLRLSASGHTVSVESECRTAIKCGLAEVSCILTSASRRLIDRRCFAELFNYNVIEPDELRVLVYPSVDGGGLFIAQCLDFDVVAAGKGPDRAVKQLDSTLGVWFEEFLSRKEKLIHPGIAPACFHAAFLDGGEARTYEASHCGATRFQVQSLGFPVKHSYKIRHEKILSGDADVIKSANHLFYCS
jgi:predicted RNase H-like HicB family nuclease